MLIAASIAAYVLPVSVCMSRPLTINDILSRESVGSSAFSPDGKYLVYERAHRYADHEDFATLDPVVPFGSLKTDAVQIVDLRTLARSRPLLPAKAGTRHWLGGSNQAAGFSPSGRHLLVYELEGSRVSLWSVEVANGAARKLHHTPDFSEVPKLRKQPVWLSDDVVIYAALNGGDQSYLPTYLRKTGEGYAQAWARSWAGREPSFAEWRTDGGEVLTAGQLVMENVRTGRVDVLGQGRYTGIQASPDGHFVAAIGPIVDVSVCPARGLGILLYSVQSGQGRFVTCGVSLGSGSVMTRIRWAPDSKSFAYFGWQDMNSTQGTYRVIRTRAGAQTGYSHRGVILESYGDSANLPVDFVWNGKALIVAGRPAGSATEVGVGPLMDSDTRFGERHWYTLTPTAPKELPGIPAAETGVAAGRNSLFAIRGNALYQNAGSGWRKIKLSFEPAELQGLEDFFLQENPRVLVVKGRTAQGEAQAVIDAGTGAVLPRRAALAADGLSSLDRTAQWEFRHSEDGNVYSLQRPDGASVEIDRINAFSKEVEAPRCVEIDYESQLTGQPVTSSLFLPPNYKEGGRLPTIVRVYPSVPRGSCSHGDDLTALLTARGFIVLIAATPASAQRLSIERLWDGMPALVEDAAQAAVRKGYADPQRLGLFGFSQGGHASLWVVAKTRLFKTAVAVNGASDQRIQYFAGGDLPGFPLVDSYPPHVNRNFEKQWGDVGMGHSALDRSDVYVANSAINFVRDIEAPVLLVNSDMDSFPRDQFKSMYAALVRAGKPARLVTFWGEGHHMASPANLRAYYAMLGQWYEEHLLEEGGTVQASGP